MQVVIRPNTNIGELDAESDNRFLSECFVDNGLIEVLYDVEEVKSIVLGRTGSGKTATLMHIESESNKNRVKLIDLENLFLNYIDNSNIIKFLQQNDINLDIFYRYLWRHILTIEFLKLKYPDWSESKKLANFISEIYQSITKPNQKIAYEYLKNWSDKYWIETEENVKEIMENLTQNIQAETGVSVHDFFNGKLNSSSENAKEVKTEVQKRVQAVVDKIQISELSKVVEVLNEHVFSDRQNPYYLLIDKLDENWTSPEIRHGLIKALIEEIKFFRKIRNVKILASLRVDLFLKTIEQSRSAGFQEDKLQSIIYKVKWSEKDLKDIVNKRISYLYKSKYTKENVCFEDIFPSPNRKGEAWNYILQRTFWRPRDILQFINYCLENSVNKVSIDWGAIQDAEKIYSRERLRSLYEEWHDIYPSLEYIVPIISDMQKIEFSIDEFRENLSDEMILKVSIDIQNGYSFDPLYQAFRNYLDESPDKENLVNIILSCFYQVGLFGLSEKYSDSYDWSFKDIPYKSKMECGKTNYIKVHKMFCSALHIYIE
ncbi:Uncharacterised protein [Moraxella lacunata]|uniref:DNA repair protein n=1 Tax=Moraxella lacunata TaxID=477 RepID=A0A378TU20_MORLA|nr:hypothetical protein [Moraxella lacunata]STZ64237.1 Uncharacterised protein [Moraxella lacunata]